MPHSLETLGLKIPHIYLPENTRALDTWCVIACDQYTSDPAYWENVERTVGDQPSTLKMVLRTSYLHWLPTSSTDETALLTGYAVCFGRRRFFVLFY